MLIDATRKFEERQWQNQLLSAANQFVEGDMNLDSFVEKMHELGFDNVLTKGRANDE